MKTTSIVTGLIAALALAAYFAAMHDATKRPISSPEQPEPSAPERVTSEAHRERSTEDRGPPEIPTPMSTELGLAVLPNGELMIDGTTRSVVEELSAVADVSELYEITDHLQQTLPPAAGERAADLVVRYYRYRIALDERLRHDEIAALPQDATIALDALKGLRAEFFGPELTELWFGKEDAIGREMIAQAERLSLQ